MKNLFLSVALLLIPFLGIAQSESSIDKRLSAKFEKNYNAGEYQHIYEIFSPEMKTALPMEQTVAFLTGVKNNVGNILKREFKGYHNGGYALYKTTFEKGQLALNISTDNNSQINGLLIKPYEDADSPKLTRNKTPMILPFTGEWFVFWGGDTPDLNYHVDHRAQTGAFDFLITDENGKSHESAGTENEHYYAFGKEIIAPCNGEVVMAVDGINDNVPGEFNPVYVPGNTVILKTANGEYLLFAHFKQNSIVVEQGQMVETGDLLGLCGNSGNSSEPHLHFHIQNIQDLNKATGAKCYFDEIVVDGKTKKNYSPLKGEKVKNK